jgi:hypothetical protein
MAMNQKDTDFFRPLWRRVVITGLVAAWFGYETFFSRDSLWITVTGASLAYCVWNFFLRFPKDPPGSTGGGTPPVAPSGSPDGNSGDVPKA